MIIYFLRGDSALFGRCVTTFWRYDRPENLKFRLRTCQTLRIVKWPFVTEQRVLFVLSQKPRVVTCKFSTVIFKRGASTRHIMKEVCEMLRDFVCNCNSQCYVEGSWAVWMGLLNDRNYAFKHDHLTLL